MRKPSNRYGAISQTTFNKDHRNDFIFTKILINRQFVKMWKKWLASVR